MPTTIRRIILLASLLALAATAQAQPDPERLASDFGDFFGQRVVEENIPGATFAVVTPDKIVLIGTAGYTDTSRRTPVNENTVFRIASVSKTFAAGLTAVLVAEGAFGWDDRVVDHLPWFRLKGDAGALRVRDLVGQSTGLIPHAYDNLIDDGVALERILPKSRGQWRTVDVEPKYYQLGPAAGVNASALDMARWLMAQLGANPEVLAPEMIRTVTDPRVETRRDLRRKHWRDILTDAHYGLGWRIYRVGAHELVYHSGWVSGYRADIAWSEEYGLGLAILMNSEGSTISELSTDFWQRVFRQPPASAGGELLTATAAAR